MSFAFNLWLKKLTKFNFVIFEEQTTTEDFGVEAPYPHH